MNRAPKFEGEDPVKLHNHWTLTTNERSVSLSFDKDSDISEYLKAEWTNVNYVNKKFTPPLQIMNLLFWDMKLSVFYFTKICYSENIIFPFGRIVQ